MNEKTTITLSGTRGEEWERVLGTRTLAILSPSAEVCILEGNTPEEESCVMLDVAALSEPQRRALIEHLARRFNAKPEDVELDALTKGLPVRLGPDARINVPPGYRAPRRSESNGRAFDLRMLT